MLCYEHFQSFMSFIISMIVGSIIFGIIKPVMQILRVFKAINYLKVKSIELSNVENFVDIH